MLNCLICSAFAGRASAYCVELTQQHHKLGAAKATWTSFPCTLMYEPLSRKPPESDVCMQECFSGSVHMLQSVFPLWLCSLRSSPPTMSQAVSACVKVGVLLRVRFAGPTWTARHYASTPCKLHNYLHTVMKQLLSRPDYVCTPVHVDLVSDFFSFGDSCTDGFFKASSG